MRLIKLFVVITIFLPVVSFAKQESSDPIQITILTVQKSAKHSNSGNGGLWKALGGAALSAAGAFGGVDISTGAGIASRALDSMQSPAASSSGESDPMVRIFYKNSFGEMKVTNSVGRVCDFKKGTAIAIPGRHKSLEVQPNATCPVSRG